MESRYFVVNCPVDIHVGFERNKEGKPAIVHRNSAQSAIRTSKLSQMLTMVNEREWRYPDRPTLQLQLPYLFLADETVYMTQLAHSRIIRQTPCRARSLVGVFRLIFGLGR